MAFHFPGPLSMDLVPERPRARRWDPSKMDVARPDETIIWHSFEISSIGTMDESVINAIDRSLGYNYRRAKLSPAHIAPHTCQFAPYMTPATLLPTVLSALSDLDVTRLGVHRCLQHSSATALGAMRHSKLAQPQAQCEYLSCVFSILGYATWS